MQAHARLVLLTAFIVLLFNSGVRFSMGLVLKPMADDLAWTRTSLSLAVTTFMIVSALALPFAGRLVDRFGAVTVLGLSVVLMGAGTAAMSLVNSPLEALLCYGIIVAAGSAGTSIAPIGVLVSRWFPERLGLANSVAISGMGVGQLVIVLALASYFEQLGWRGAFVALGVANVVVVLPLLAFTASRQPREAETPALASAHGEAAGRSVRDIAHTRYFWWLLLTYAICGFHDFLMATHIVAFALDQGMGSIVSGNMLAFMGLAGLAGVLAAGFFTDRYGPVWPTLLCFALRIVLFGLLLNGAVPMVVIACALSFGATFWITAPLTVVFVQQRFGIAHLGVVAGIVTMVHHIFGGLGAYVGAVSFDVTGNYDAAFTLALCLSAIGLFTSWQLRLRKRIEAI